MATFKLEHDRQCMCQWDLNQRLIIENVAPGTQVHFNGIPSTPYTEDGFTYADVPNEVLQESGVVKVYAYIYDKAEGYTKESFDLGVSKREKPEDYDANIKFGDILNEINGEVVPGGVSEKLNYLKQCLDTLYQSPPIKLMREVYGENRTLRELCEYVSDNEKKSTDNICGASLTYAVDKTNAGFNVGKRHIVYPNGDTLDVRPDAERIFISPYAYLLPSTTPYNLTSRLGTAYVNLNGALTVSDVYLIDLQNIKFLGDTSEELYKNYLGFGFKAVCGKIYGMYLPKVFHGMANTLYVNSTIKALIKGLHLGRVVKSCSADWIFPYETVDPSTQPETPVYCDKDFYGTIYLEKLNIPIECLIDIMDNATFIKDAYSIPILSIGDTNASKIYGYMQENMSQDMIDITEDEGYTDEQKISMLKEIDRYIGVYFEFEMMKGWQIV